MLLVGEDPRKHIPSFSNDFLRDFLKLLAVMHGEKQVHINHFYHEYIANNQHIHLNATKWCIA
jgi:DNA/RNA-binding protein KIN17